MNIVLLTLITATLSAQPVDRVETSLNGSWEYVKVADLDAPPPTDGWQPMEVPGQLHGFNYERAWFRRTFACDALAGRRAKLHFGGVKWNSRVTVNSKPVGGNFGGMEPFDVDITDAVRLGADNELLVGVCDWTGIFEDRATDLSEIKGVWSRDVPRDEALSPVGGLTENYGIWDDVKLVTHAPVYVGDLCIKTSVANKRITVEFTVTNESATAVTASVSAEVERSEDADRLPRFEAQTASVPAGESRSVTLQADWPNPHLWSHLDPHLYFLKTTLSTGDVLRTRFGFREFGVRGPSFYLNGRKINLLATSWWPTANPMTPEAIREQMKWMQYARCVAFRTHTQPWCERWYEIADEVGIMMIPEGAVWNDDALYRLDDQRFWDNYALHLQKMVDRDKNKPSVIMWSLENEFYGGRLVDGSPSEQKLADMGRIVKQADPTRPIFYESDGDPGGVADAIGIHYPHEYPNFVQWPNEADWMDKPIPLTWAFTGGTGEFFWKKDKPLYIGEFLWIPSSDPSWDTVWFGDESYRNYQKYHVLAKAESWRQQIIGYRRHEVPGISPWTMIEGGALNEDNPLVQAHRYAYRPIAAFPREYDSRFFSGETVTRTLDVFNDSFADRKLTVEWSARLGDMGLPGGRTELNMASGAREVADVELKLPPVQGRTDGAYLVRVLEDGQPVFEETHDISVFPRLGPATVASAKVGLYDPKGTSGKLLAGAATVTDLAKLPDGLEVLVIGAEALTAPEQARPAIGGGAGSSLSDWVARGGRAVLLEQTAWPREVVPAQLGAHASTMTFAQAPHHPLLNDVRADDLKYWRGDHLITAAEPLRPDAGPCVPVVVSGSSLGLAHAPLMVVPHGDGAYVICQLKVATKWDTEPTAQVLARNLVAYAQGYPVDRRRTTLYCDLPETRRKLDDMRVQAEDLTDRLNEADLNQYHLLIYASSSANPLVPQLGRLVPWVESGGNVLIHGLAPEEYAKLADVLDPQLRLAPHAGHALRGTGDDPLLFSFANEDLYWLGKHSGHSWATTTLSQDTATAVFEPLMQRENAQELSANDMELSGGIVGRIKDQEGVFFATVGSGKLTADFPTTGQYLIGIVARGTPVDGAYPIADVLVDGQSIGALSIRSNEWETYSTFGHVEAGRRTIQVAFTNDASKPPNEDRNLYVRSVVIAPSAISGRSVLLTHPGALARFPKGKGSFVIDEITWDTEEQNATQATRFICGLLTALGARFGSEVGVMVEAEDMEPQPGMPHFSKGGGRVVIATNGYIETEVEVVRPGRYRTELVAGGSPAEGQYPIVDVSMGDGSLGAVQLTTGNLKPYPLKADLAQGVQKLRVTFTNDRNALGEDRNLYVDRVVFYGPE